MKFWFLLLFLDFYKLGQKLVVVTLASAVTVSFCIKQPPIISVECWK